MKMSPKPFFKFFIVLLTISILPLTSCKEEEAEPQLPILYVQILLEENGQDLFELDSYSLDETDVYWSYQNERRDNLMYFKYDADTASFIGLTFLQWNTMFIFHYGNGDTDTLEWNILSDSEPGAQDDLYVVYFNGELNHEIQMNKKLLNDMGLPFDKNITTNNIVYPVIKK